MTDHVGFFDRLAHVANNVVSRAPYFSACMAVVILWAIWGPFVGFTDSWQLVINTGTTIITFLMVALLQNSARRSDLAVQHKLNAIADALADMMAKNPSLERDVQELRRAVGLEAIESA